MKRFLLAGAAIGAMMAGPALAADMRMPVKAPPAPAPVAFNWSGFYIGGHVGGAWGKKEWSVPAPFFGDEILDFGSHDVSGIIAGGQIGFNWQAPGSNWVLGIEAQASWSNADGEHIFTEPGGPDSIGFRSEVEWLGTVTGRIGYAFDRVLVYAKGGFAFAHDNFEIFNPTGPEAFSADKTRTGWTVGGGIEVALGGNWSAKGEYNFMDLGKKSVTFTDGDDFIVFDVDQRIHVVKFGINYRFGSFGGPVVARY